MKKMIALFLSLVMLFTMGLVPVSSAAEEITALPDESVYVFTEADNAILEADVFAGIEQVKLDAAQTCRGIGKMTEQDYAALVPQVIEKVKSSDTYVPGSLIQNGYFLVWQTTVGIPCCYDPRMEAKLHNTDNEPTAEEIAAAEAQAAAILEEFDEIQGGFPSSLNIGLIQPYWESTSNYADRSFNGYSPTYKSLWQGLQSATGGQGLRYTMNNATVDNIAYTMEQCGLVAFDSHGTTDYTGYGEDYVSQANTSYLCLITNSGVTSQDTAPQQGPYGTYYHCLKGSGYAYVDGTCIANHMSQNAPHSFLYMGICLGMATDGMEAGLRAKGVEAIWGYSQSVSFEGDIEYVKDLLNNIKTGDNLATAAAKVKAQYGNWDPAYSSYSYSQAVANYVAFPIVASSEDPYPGHGNVDVVQTVNSTWTLFSQYTINAVSNNDAWGTVSVNYRMITAEPAYGYYVAGYEVLQGTATVTQNGNIFEVDAESDCTIQINFAPRDPAVVNFSVPEGVTCAPINAYVGDYINLPEPEGQPAVDGYEYRFLGWLTAPMDADSLDMPEFSKAGTSIKLEQTQNTYYALYSYFVAVEGLNDDQFVRVDEAPHSWTGEYVITYEGVYALGASKEHGTGAAVGNTKAVVDLADAGCTYEDNILNNVTKDITYVIEPAPDGTYTVKMKSINHYLALTRDTDSLATYTSSNTAKTRWNITMGANGPVFTNAQYPTRKLQYNSESKLFRCYTTNKQPLTLFAKADGDTWYTTNPKNKVICDEHTFGDWVEGKTPTCTESGLKYRFCSVCNYKETQVLEALGHEFDDGVVTTQPTPTQPGVMTYTCVRCGETRTEEIPAIAHDCPCAMFKDMPAYGTIEHAAIDWAYTHEPFITDGIADDEFGVNMTVNRGQAVTFLYRASGNPTVTGSNPFTDLTQNWYKNPITWAFNSRPQITDGMTETTFEPDTSLNRAMMLTFLYRQQGKPAIEASDAFAEVPEWYRDAMIWALQKGIIDENTNWEDDCPRVDVVVYLFRVYEPEAAAAFDGK